MASTAAVTLLSTVHQSVAHRVVHLALIGATGRVGRQLLNLIGAQASELEGLGLSFRLVLAANSRTSVFDANGIDVGVAASLLESSSARIDGVADLSARCPQRPLIVIDCTASADVTSHYPRWLAAGIDVVTPNKHASSGDRALHRAIIAASAAGGACLRDSTTVGAQLPLLSTLRELRAAGDRVQDFQAVLSGTLSYVLSTIQNGESLSTAVRSAVAQGYAEPNPARDLSGEDAARKLVILLRALGHDIELADVERVPLIEPELLEERDPSTLLAGLSGVDELWRARSAIAQSRHERWIYRASFENGHARVAPERVPFDHALANLKPCENALILRSRYYSSAPLTISGPGAGIELTAAGVFGDLLAAAQHPAFSQRDVRGEFATESAIEVAA
jgi:bifunctional aspartokinase / homoserine dehydrogenase 1